MKFIQLTDFDTNEQLLIFFGTGGVIKVQTFDDKSTELYNEAGNMVAKVKEDVNIIQRKM